MGFAVKITIKQICTDLFLIAYALFLSYSLLGHISSLHESFKIISIASIAIFVLCFILQLPTYKLKEILIIAGILLLGLIVASKSADYLLVKLVIFLLAAKNVDFRKIVRFDLKIRLILIVLVMLLCKIGVAEDVIFEFEGFVRHSLGFTNPNTLGCAILILVFDVLYMTKMKLGLISTPFVVALMLFLYFFAGCRTVAILIILALLVCVINTYFKKLICNNFTKTILSLLLIICAAMTFICLNLYENGNSLMLSLNDLLSNRLGIISMFNKAGGFSIFGQSFDIARSLDNAYAYACFHLGVVVFALFAIGYFFLIRKLYKMNDIALVLILSLLMIYGLSEHLWINADYNVFMLVWSLLIFNKPADTRNQIGKNNMNLIKGSNNYEKR